MDIGAGQAGGELIGIGKRDKRDSKAALLHKGAQFRDAITARTEGDANVVVLEPGGEIEDLVGTVSSSETAGIQQRETGIAEDPFPFFGVRLQRGIRLVQCPWQERLSARAGRVLEEQLPHAGPDIRNNGTSAIGGSQNAFKETGRQTAGRQNALSDGCFRIEVEAPMDYPGAWTESIPEPGGEDAEYGVSSDNQHVRAR